MIAQKKVEEHKADSDKLHKNVVTLQKEIKNTIQLQLQ
jgi:hypothetical protein